jgi:hypothetical protein
MALPLGGATPDAMVKPVIEGVLQARLSHGAVHADPPGDLDANVVTRKEHCGRQVSTLAIRHPVGVHDDHSLPVPGDHLTFRPCGLAVEIL